MKMVVAAAVIVGSVIGFAPAFAEPDATEVQAEVIERVDLTADGVADTGGDGLDPVTFYCSPAAASDLKLAAIYGCGTAALPPATFTDPEPPAATFDVAWLVELIVAWLTRYWF